LQNQELRTVEEYIKKLREKIEKIHTYVRGKLSLKSSRVKVQYDRKARQALFKEGQKVWLYNPRRFRGTAPKLQGNWEGPFTVIRKLSDVVYCIQKTLKHRRKVVYSDRLALFVERQLD